MLPLLLVCVSLWPAHSFAQDLFELEVFPYETAPRGETEIAAHLNGIPGRTATGAPATVDYPFHVSVELSHGWTDRFELAVFLESAPVSRSDGARFAGGHVRSTYHVPALSFLPFEVAALAEYGVNRTPFDDARQVVEIVPIVGRRMGRFAWTINPTWSTVIEGPESPAPKWSASAKVEWHMGGELTPGLEYYWKPEILKHFVVDADRHHILLPVVDVGLSSGWELNVGAGHCVTDPKENWVLKAIVGYRFR
jgi:hypothetical protein